MDTNEKDLQSVYEIGYLIATSLPEEKIPEETEILRKVVTSAGAEVIAEEAPHKERLAYTMRKKAVSGAYEKYDSAYFGWIKFEVGSDKIEAIKKIFEVHPSVLRMLLITTARENTYLGKHALVLAAEIKRPTMPGERVERTERPVMAAPKPLKVEEKKPAEPVSIEEMDKSIDEMVKEV